MFETIKLSDFLIKYQHIRFLINTWHDDAQAKVHGSHCCSNQTFVRFLNPKIHIQTILFIWKCICEATTNKSKRIVGLPSKRLARAARVVSSFQSFDDGLSAMVRGSVHMMQQ